MGIFVRWESLVSSAIKTILCASFIVPAYAGNKELHPFRFTSATYTGQSTTPVCDDFLTYLNNPRSNQIFNQDGPLARATKKFQSVHWEPLDKKLYREKYLLLDSNLNREEFVRFYDSKESILQRAKVEVRGDRFKEMQNRIQSDIRQGVNRQRWLYRIVSKKPKPRNIYDPQSIPELPFGFPAGSKAWLGNVNGDPYPLYNPKFRRSLGGGDAQWFTYTPTGYIYEVENQTCGGAPGKMPNYLRLVVSELDVGPGSDRPVAQGTCEYRARND
jgi:hypothetical protein